jgi:pimeloyl-ACP methyl ester carboxylesterase
MKEKSLPYKGETFYYRVSGKGKPVMLVHGFIEEGGMWDETAKKLQDNYKVIIPDLPGFGKSKVNNWDKAVATQGLTMQWYAGYLKAICDAEKIKTMVLLGHSMGGYITLHFAEKYPGLLKGFGLLNAHCYADSDEKKANRLKGIEFIRKHGSAPFVAELYNSIFHDVYKNKHQKFIDKLIEKAAKYTPESLMRANAAMMNRQDKSLVLKNAIAPVLFISGKQDPSAPLEPMLKQVSLPAIADVSIFDNCKHMSIFEYKKETIAAIQNFIARS